MRRSEVSVESLKALGYEARKEFVNHWRFGSRTNEPCNEKQAQDLFELVVKAARNGGQYEIRRNNATHTVNVYMDATRHDYGGSEMIYFLSRPMSAAEILEANLYCGNWEDEQR